ncbi:helix-turn-helix domain-containing protein [Haloarcula sp. S1CR25-12]|uniref:Helix-turn-helix domain-containing protein n=1 Tax=Haloarcula saliterrae TaxID=2950534 RepID=A0ABU2FH50_9EURY|nr:thiamine-phosphate synthase family protein [Haloarcula sp. S1CR25-12]MDS0261600.1 helix-turn-helix domain-containing protein [Haloarcula sp. S1CR25-12]
MSLRLPSEIVVEDVLPTLRVLLARELGEHGLTQREIAEHLGVTQAAVSTYVSGEPELESRIAEHPRTAETVASVAAGLADGEMDGYDALAAVLELVRAFEDRGPICELHEEAMPELEGLGCDLCVRGANPELHTERAVLDDVREAARVLATSPGVATAVPNVGTNVGTALPEATEVADVAAIPGRIYEMGGRVEVPANPEFGASEHVATTILAAMAEAPDRRGAVNLATDDAVLDAAETRGLDRMAFEAGYENRGDRLTEQFGERGSVPDVLFHRGAFGIEPITYVLGETGADAARLAAELVADE